MLFRSVDIAYKLKLNEWQGKITLQLELIGVRPATPTSSPMPAPAQPASAPQSAAAVTLKLPFEAGAVGNRPDAITPPSTAPTAGSTGPRAEMAEAPSRYDRPPSSPTAQFPTTPAIDQVDFFYAQRRYRACTLKKGASRELQVHNPEGQVLVVLLPEKQGYLCLPGQSPQPIDITEAHYFNLVRAGLDALEIRQKTHLLLEKDELLADKDQHIETLMRQIEFLQAQSSPLSSMQKQQFQHLQAEVAAQETVVQSQVAHIETLQQAMTRPVITLDPKAIKRAVRSEVGDKIWFCLQTDSQKDLYAAYKQVALMLAEAEAGSANADYSAAGKRLGTVIEREVVQPWLEDLYHFVTGQGATAIGGVKLAAGRQYSLAIAPPLLAAQWSSLRSAALTRATRIADDQLYHVTSAQPPLSQADQMLMADFFEQWEHPMSRWCQADPETVAAYLDQISQVSRIATQTTAPLYGWAYELMRGLIVGTDDTPGLFQQIYGPA